MKSKIQIPDSSRDEGTVLPLVMIVVIIVSTLGVNLVRLSEFSSVEVSNDLSMQQAFWSAEAGLEEAKTIAKKNHDAGEDKAFPTTDPHNWTGINGIHSYTVSVVEDTMSITPAFTVTSTGNSAGGRTRTVRLGINQIAAITAGAFADESLQLQPNVDVCSYSSSSGPLNPDPDTDSTGEASVGSNEEIDIQPGCSLDGEILLGEDENGNPATCDGGDSFPQEDVGRMNPDPLGVVDGYLADRFVDAQSINDNASVSFISGTVFSMSKNDSLSMPGGVYYVTEININGELIATNGMVEIFLSGPALFDTKSTINQPGLPTNLRIYSNSTASIRAQPNGNLHAFIYAPLSEEIRLQPNDDFCGAIWGSNVLMQPGGEIFIDTDLLEYGAFDTYQIAMEQWRQVL